MTVQSVLRDVLKLVLCGIVFFPALALGGMLASTLGFLTMLVAWWMPLSVRVPHMLEIVADEFVYALALVWLLAPGAMSAARTQSSRLAGRGAAA